MSGCNLQPGQQAMYFPDFKVTAASHDANVMPSLLNWAVVSCLQVIRSIVWLYRRCVLWLPCTSRPAGRLLLLSIAHVMPSQWEPPFWQDSHTFGHNKGEDRGSQALHCQLHGLCC